MTDRLLYLYGIVPAALDAASAPAGLDDGPVTLVRDGALGALASEVDAQTYAAQAEALVGDVAWLGPRAAAHDRVTTWASDAGAVVPLPMFTLFRDAAGVRAMLAARREELAALLARAAAGREYVLRLYRLDDVLGPALAAVSPGVAALERQMEEASPGQRYLLQRKLEQERKNEIRRVGLDSAREAWESLRALALDAATDELPRAEGARGAAVLNAAFLVAHEAWEPFQREVTAIVRRLEPLGFRVEFTGPWPPHHFARLASAMDAGADAGATHDA